MHPRLLLGSVAACVFALDRVSKLLADALLEIGNPKVVIPYLLELSYCENHGIALGILSGNAIATLILPVIAMLAWFLVFRNYRLTSFIAVASGLLLGGFVGNFWDRVLLGHVVDMLYFPFLPWFICNVADIAICAGVVMMAASLLFRPQDWRERDADQSGSSPT